MFSDAVTFKVIFIFFACYPVFKMFTSCKENNNNDHLLSST